MYVRSFLQPVIKSNTVCKKYGDKKTSEVTKSALLKIIKTSRISIKLGIVVCRWLQYIGVIDRDLVVSINSKKIYWVCSFLFLTIFKKTLFKNAS